jgi:hypothetical protein
VRLIVSVSGADDALPRSGLAVSNFNVVSVASDEDTALRQQLIAQAGEGPAAIYRLVLEGDGQPSTLVPRTIILAITVSRALRAVGRTTGDSPLPSAARLSSYRR